MVPTDTGVRVDSGEPISGKEHQGVKKHNKVTWNTSKSKVNQHHITRSCPERDASAALTESTQLKQSAWATEEERDAVKV